jgi:hypothetical protein
MSGRLWIGRLDHPRVLSYCQRLASIPNTGILTHWHVICRMQLLCPCAQKPTCVANSGCVATAAALLLQLLACPRGSSQPFKQAPSAAAAMQQIKTHQQLQLARLACCARCLWQYLLTRLPAGRRQGLCCQWRRCLVHTHTRTRGCRSGCMCMCGRA